MPFLIVSEDDYQKELERISPSKIENSNDQSPDGLIGITENDTRKQNEEIINSLEISTTKLGRGWNGGRGNTTEIPQCLRELVAEEKLSGSSSKSISNALGVSSSQVSAYAHGNTSTATYNKPQDELSQVRTRVAKRASSTLNAALKALNGKDLNEEKAKDLSGIAKDMAIVFDRISPVAATERAEGRELHLHMYTPKMKQLSDYEVIDVNVERE